MTLCYINGIRLRLIGIRSVSRTRRGSRETGPGGLVKHGHAISTRFAFTTSKRHCSLLTHSLRYFIMSRGTRFLTLAIPAFIIYLLLLSNILPLPLISQETANQILPVVRPISHPSLASEYTDNVDPILVTSFLWELFVNIPRSWAT